MNTKKRNICIVALGLLLSSSFVFADDDDDDYKHKNKHHFKNHYKHQYYQRPEIVREQYVYATVIAVEPIMERVTHTIPRQSCWEEVRYERRSSSATGTILGGIVGGVVGNQFGEGRGKDAMTIAGTLLGGSIGNDVSRGGGGTRAVTEERCRTNNEYREERRVSGYYVTYRYRGETHTTQMDHDPGDQVRIKVAIYVDD